MVRARTAVSGTAVLEPHRLPAAYETNRNGNHTGTVNGTKQMRIPNAIRSIMSGECHSRSLSKISGPMIAKLSNRYPNRK
jgi:hypothetical protein